MNSTTYIIFFAVAMLFTACVQPTIDTGKTGVDDGTGRAVFTITDAAADMGTVTIVKVTIAGAV